MPRNPGYRNVAVLLSPEQHAALSSEAAARGVELSALIRQALASVIEDFPADDVPRRGTYRRNLMQDRYTLSQGDAVPRGRWDEHGPVDFKTIAARAASIVRAERRAISLTVWDQGSPAVEMFETGKVRRDAELNPPEHAYIARALANALRDVAKGA